STQVSTSNQEGYVSDGSEGRIRRSSRITTPVKRSGMIQPSPDSRRSIFHPLLLDHSDSASNSEPLFNKRKRIFMDPNSSSQNTSTAKTRKKKQTSIPETSEVIDIEQDSDNENRKIQGKRRKRNPEFNEPKDFFSEPFRRNDDPDDKPAQTYSCSWCKKEVRVSGSSLSNLRTHRDGSRQAGRNSHGCAKRHDAITAGAKLPPTVHEEEKLNILRKDGTITNYFAPTKKFDKVVFNQIVTLWLLRQAIPWNRVEDPYLQAVFHYCAAGATLFKRNLQEAMIKRLKMALVVNAGLKELGIESPPPPKLKKDFLGPFPYSHTMEKILEETEDEATNDEATHDKASIQILEENTDESDADYDSDDVEYEEDILEDGDMDGNADINPRHASRNQNTSATNRNGSNELNELTKAVIDSMLHDEYVKYQDQIVRSSQKENRKKLGHFKETQFTSKDWMLIDELNQELKPFNRLTKIMEGDGPTGAFVLPNYYQIIVDLKKKKEACDRGHALHPMFVKMIAKLEVYQTEALECKTLVMSTILHPSFRLKLFSHSTRPYEEAGTEQDRNIQKINPENIFELFTSPQSTDESKELEAYTKNIDRIPGPSAKDAKALLRWWK
ncbi:hypothetical protein PSTT_13832, partial [Puccinia striiformis]